MGHDKLRKFAENEMFSCLVQPSSKDLLANGYEHLRDHPLKGRWSDFFADLPTLPAGHALPHSSSSSHSMDPALIPSFDKSVAVPACHCHSVAPLPPCPDTVRNAGLAVSPSPAIRRSDSPRPLIVELGCGKGEYTIALSRRNEACDYLGVDIKGARLWKGAKFATENHLPNVGFLRTRVEFIAAFFAPSEVSEIWLTFSDPQYRSVNSRLTAPVFLERYRRFLKPDGIVHLKTDSQFLYQYTLAVCRVNDLKIIAHTDDLYGTRTAPSAASSINPEAYEVHTFYENMFLEQGYPISYLSFTIDHDGAFFNPADPSDFDSDHWRTVEGPRVLFGADSAETRRRKLLDTQTIPPSHI